MTPIQALIDLNNQAQGYKKLNEKMHRQIIEYQAAFDKIRFWCDSETTQEQKLNHIYFLAQQEYRGEDD